MWSVCGVFFFQAEDGIRDDLVTGVQTCALPICSVAASLGRHSCQIGRLLVVFEAFVKPAGLSQRIREIGKALPARFALRRNMGGGLQMWQQALQKLWVVRGGYDRAG